MLFLRSPAKVPRQNVPRQNGRRQNVPRQNGGAKTVAPKRRRQNVTYRLRRYLGSLLNPLSTGQGPCMFGLKKWGLARRNLFECGELHTMFHTVDSCIFI